MDQERLGTITERYSSLSVDIFGDFCLDRYLEIDPAKAETSIETNLPVHNVVNVRAQPGGAGTILNNLAALGVGAIYPLGFAGEDGEGFELWRALEQRPGARLSHFVKTVQRRTFTYCKPLIIAPHQPPRELNRLDSKNWTPTPSLLQGLLINRLREAAEFADAVIVLDQVDVPETGVVTRKALAALAELSKSRPELPILADSRRGLRGFPSVIFKMNASELAVLSGTTAPMDLDEIRTAAAALAATNGRSVFVTLSENGILGATRTGHIEAVPALPLRGEIDIVGAGDAVTANLAAALAGGASIREALEMANAAASVVVHKLGTTGTASVAVIRSLLVQ